MESWFILQEIVSDIEVQEEVLVKRIRILDCGDDVWGALDILGHRLTYCRGIFKIHFHDSITLLGIVSVKSS